MVNGLCETESYSDGYGDTGYRDLLSGTVIVATASVRCVLIVLRSTYITRYNTNNMFSTASAFRRVT